MRPQHLKEMLLSRETCTYFFAALTGFSNAEGCDVITARRNARIASAVLATAIPSICPSVRPSVCHKRVLCQNNCT